jgi:hypothetical protein
MASNAAVQNVVKMLVSGNLSAWEQGYHDLLFMRVMGEKIQGAPVMAYEYKDRAKLYSFIYRHVLKSVPVDYLEFGVFQGESMRAWLSLSPHPESRFHGFDSFEGLPEDWATGQKEKGHFSTGGQIPDIDDSRVRFRKGWFHETLPAFMESYKPQNRLVVHLDADLFSSTLCVLMNIDKIVAPGTVMIFDDFNPRDDFAALHQYGRACKRDWKVLAAREGLGKIGIEIV